MSQKTFEGVAVMPLRRGSDHRLLVPYNNGTISDRFIDALVDTVFGGLKGGCSKSTRSIRLRRCLRSIAGKAFPFRAKCGGSDGTRTRDLLPDRQAF